MPTENVRDEPKKSVERLSWGCLSNGNAHQVLFLGASVMNIIKARDNALETVPDYLQAVRVLNVVLRLRMISALSVQISARKLKAFRNSFDALHLATSFRVRRQLIRKLRKLTAENAHLSYPPPNPRHFKRRRLGAWLVAEEQREVKGRPAASWEVDTIALLLAAYPLCFEGKVQVYAQSTLSLIRCFNSETLYATRRFEETHISVKRHLTRLLGEKADSALFKHIAFATKADILADDGSRRISSHLQYARFQLACQFPTLKPILEDEDRSVF